MLRREGQNQASLGPYLETTGTVEQVAGGEEMPVCARDTEPHKCLADSRRWTRRIRTSTGVRTTGKIQAGSVGRSVLVVGSFYGAMSLSGLQTWPNQTMPLIAAQHLVGDEEVASHFVIEVQIDRPITLFFTGIIIPCMLMVSGMLLPKLEDSQRYPRMCL